MPVIMAEIGWVAMGIVDTLMVGRLGADAIGAVGLASMLFFAISVFAMGLMLGLDPLIAHAFGAGRIDECHHWLVQGLWLGVIVAAPSMLVVWALDWSLAAWGLPAGVLALSRPYLAILDWSLPLLLCYVAARRYLQAMELVRPITIALVAANVVNAAGNWVLIFGHLGMPALGVRGSAFSTVAARLFLAAALLATIVRNERRVKPRLRETSMRIDLGRLKRLLAIGLPAAGQTVLEVGVFAAATALAGRVSAQALAAHQIALNFAALTFMVPFGLASAAAVRVGHAVGRRDRRGAAAAGWMAIALGVFFMSAAAVVFLT
ncbi:MAG TPA: MATE family efflux transporter, partial [Vicinamibacterales bacterium]